MNSLLSRLGLAWHEALSCLLWIGLGAGVAFTGLLEFADDWRFAAAMLLLAAGFLYAGFGYALDLPAAPVLVVPLSVLLVLYALLLVTLGMEDVGGPRVALPWALALVLFAAYNLILVCVIRPPRGGASAG